MGNKISRRTQGSNQEIFVAKNQAEGDDATLAAFVASATLGDIALYDKDGARHTNLITASEYLQVVQKMTGGIKKSVMMKFSEIVARKTAYAAAVKWAGQLGWTGSTGGLYLPNTVATGLNYEFSILELTEGNQPYPTWNFNYTTIPNDAEIDVVLALVKQVNDTNNVVFKNIERAVSAAALASATYSNFAMGAGGTITATLGSATLVIATGAYNAAVGDYIAFTSSSSAITDALLTNIYKVLATDTTSYITLDRPWEGATATFVEAATEGTGTSGGSFKKAATFTKTGIAFTGLNDDEHFKIARREELANATATYSAFTKGKGTKEDVKLAELEGIEFAGETTLTSPNAYKFGQADRFVDLTSGAYQVYNIEWYPQSDAKGGWERGKVKTLVTVFAHNSNSSFKTYMDTLLGL